VVYNCFLILFSIPLGSSNLGCLPVRGQLLIFLYRFPWKDHYMWSGCYMSLWYLICQGVKIVFKVGLALLKYRHDDLVSISRSFLYSERNSCTAYLIIGFLFVIRSNCPLKNLYMLCAISPRMQWIQIHYYLWRTPSRFSLSLYG